MIRSFPRDYDDALVVGYKDFYIIGRYLKITFTKYSLFDSSPLHTYSLANNAAGADSILANEKYFYIRN
jgi:hypothetical protein